MVLAMLDIIMARDLLSQKLKPKLMLLILAMDILMHMVMLMFHLDPALVLTQSPKVLTL